MKGHLLIPLLLFFAILPGLSAPLSAAEHGIFITEEVQLGVADAFMAEGEYYRAVTEYKKFLFLFPGSKKVDYALYRVGTAHYRGNDYETAARTFAMVREKYGSGGYGAASAYFEGLSLWKLGRFDQAGEALERVATIDPASEYAPLALLGKSLVAFDERNITGCREELERFLARYPQDTRANNVRETLTLLGENQELPRKSPVLAGLLSALIPGSGYLYAGHYGDGLTALIVNGLFIAGTVVAVHQENYAVAAIVGGIGLPFYVGNIYGSANAATKWNIGVRKELRGKITVTLDYHF